MLVQQSLAASVTVKPQAGVRYTGHNNISSVSPDDEEANAAYLDYLLGLGVEYKQSRHLIELSGMASYQQWVTIDGDRYADEASAEDYSYTRIRAKVAYHYLYGDKFNFNIYDEITQNRDLREIFGDSSDSLQYYYLYTNNTAGVNLKFARPKKATLLIGYSYTTLTFDDPESDFIYRPPNRTENRGTARSEYHFTERTVGILDLQYATADHENRDPEFTGNRERMADYTSMQGMIGLRYYINENATIEGLGGVVQREYDDISGTVLPSPPYPANTLAFDIEESQTSPAANISFILRDKPTGNQFTLTATQGVSVYGANTFFDYTGINASLLYHLDPKLYFKLSGGYQRAFFDVERNGREWQWDDDRVDGIVMGNVLLHYDIFSREGAGTLSFEAGYDYRQRDSSIDGAGDYNPLYVTYVNNPDSPLLRSYDSTVQIWFVQLTFAPVFPIGQ